MGRTLTRIVSREVAGGYVKVTGAKVSRGRVRIETSIGLSYYPFREQNVRAMYDSVRAVLPAGSGGLIPFACRDAARMRRAVRFTNRSERPLVEPLSRLRTPQRGLAGRHIALWQSHGRYFDQKQNRWRWQRSCLWQTCEDLYTQSYVLPYVVPMLENAGACVLLPRERDVQKTEIVVDGDPGVDRGTRYVETDGAERWSDGGTGFAHLRSTYSDAANPFPRGGSSTSPRVRPSRASTTPAIRSVMRGARAVSRSISAWAAARGSIWERSGCAAARRCRWSCSPTVRPGPAGSSRPMP